MSEAEPESPPREHPGREGPERQLPPEEVKRATLAAVALRPGAKARAAGLGLSLCGGLTTLFAGLGLYFLQTGQGARALGLFLGHVGAQLVTASWIAGAILTFDRENDDFMRATLGATPLRFVVLATIVGLGLWLTEPDQPALFFSLMLTHVLGHVIEHLVLARLNRERLEASA